LKDTVISDTTLEPFDRQGNNAVLFEQIALLYRQTWSMLIVNLVVASALTYAMIPHAPAATVWGWFGYLVFVFLIRIAIYYFYLKYINESQLRWFARLFLVGCFLSASAWGAASIVFFQSDNLQTQALLFFIIAGMGAGSVTSMYSYQPAFLVYFVTSSLPISIRLLIEQDRTATILGALFIFFIVALSFFAARINKTFIEALRTRFLNTELVDKLRFQKEEAERANQSKSKFLAAASHDLRQPLHALTLYASVLSDNLKAKENKKLISQICSSIEALQTLFNALLDISRLEAGTLIPDVKSFYLHPMLQRIVADYQGDAVSKGISLSLVGQDVVCKTDPTLLEQVIRNYLSNAMRYTKAGEIRIQVVTTAESIEITVADTGIGIPQDQLESIFAEFYQLKNPERDRSKGLGLGLAIVKRISSLLDMPILVQSELNKGSSFSVSVPVGDDIEHMEPVNQLSNWSLPDHASRPNIVIIDDDLDVRNSTEAVFSSWGCRVFSGSTPQETIEQLKKAGELPSAIVADYRLRNGRTGIGAIDLIKAQFDSDLPALIMTGDTSPDHLRLIQNSGIPIANKPVAPSKLRAFLLNVQKQKAAY
jgi:Signal transduction histidine kinase